MTQRAIYQNDFPYLVTTNTYYRTQFLEKSEYAKILAKVIFNKTKELETILYGYSIIPDHLHLLIKTSLKANLSKVMQQVKSYYTKELRDKFAKSYKFWQPRFNFRIINTTKRLENAVYYLKNNPIKENLPSKYLEVPYLYLDKDKIEDLF